MGIEPFLVTAAVNLILAQRLARKICVDCKTEVEVDRATLVEIGFTEEQLATGVIRKGAGCKTCNDTGYKGRIALYEVMPLTDRIKQMVLQGSSTAELKEQMVAEGIKTLRMSAIGKCLEGVTTIEEILRNTTSDRM
jgi:type IV pilus assembly protein PilB